MTTTKLDEFYIRLYLGNNSDEALAQHLRQYDMSHKGAKHDEAKRLMHIGLQVVQGERNTLDQDAIHHVVREALGETQSALINALSSPDLDSDAVRRAVQEAMRETIEEIGVQERVQLSTEALASIRRVVDATLQQHLDRLSVQCKEGEGSNKDDDDENDDEAARIEELMSTLDNSLLR